MRSAAVAPSVLEGQLRHPVDAAVHVKVALLITALATIGRALGAALESDVVVRQAARGYHPQDD